MLKRLMPLLIFAMLLYSYGTEKEQLFTGADGIYTATLQGASDGMQIVFSTDDKDIFYSLKSVTGQSLTTYDGDYVEEFLNDFNCRFVFSETLNDRTVNYYYSMQIRGYRSINGKIVNVAACSYNGVYTIGTPLIYGSF